nr:DUF5953 family protein [Vitiosangium sp. GDMCC 1.1324]
MIVYAPALAGDDGRPLAVVRGMERARPGLIIGLMISDEGQLIPLPDRDAFVARESSRGEMPPLRSTDNDVRVACSPTPCDIDGARKCRPTVTRARRR